MKKSPLSDFFSKKYDKNIAIALSSLEAIQAVIDYYNLNEKEAMEIFSERFMFVMKDIIEEMKEDV